MKGPGRTGNNRVKVRLQRHVRECWAPTSPIQAKQDAREKKYEEIGRVANHDFRVRRTGSSKDQLLPHFRTLSHLH
jgi:hypothetical protein